MSTTTSEDTGPANSAYAGSVPIGTKLIYAFGGASETIINLAFNSFNFFFYTAVMGLSATLAGLAITIALVCDAITDPLIGSWSDRFRSLFGRRHLFMLAAPLPVMASLFFIYSPPALGEEGLFLWLTLFTIILRSTMTLFHIPHLALGAELSADFTERTRIMSMNTMFGFIGSFGTAFIGYTYFFTPTAEFENGLLFSGHYPVFATAVALVGGAIMFLSTLFTRNVISRLPQPDPSLAKTSASELFKDIMMALRNRNYLVLMLGLMLLSITVGTRETLNLHANTYYWELVPAEIRYFALAALPAPIIGFLIAAPLHERFEKLNTGIAFIVLYSFFSSVPVILRMAGIFPDNNSTWLLPLLLAFNMGQVTSGVMLLITSGSIIADVADEQDLLSGRRQEGVFYSARTFFGKATSGLGHLVAGIAIDVIGFPVGAEPGSVHPDKIFQLGLIEGPLSVIPALCAIIFYMRFNLTRVRHAEIQALLAEREANKS